MSADPQVEVFGSGDELATTVAQRTVELLAAAIAARGAAHLVVTGGSILEQVLGALPDAGELDWPAVHVWWGDERYVAPDSPDRNDLPAIKVAFSRVPAHLHRMPADTGAPVEEAAAAYATELGSPAFDVVLLGLGPDGHCASLFPGHPALGATGTVTAVHDSPKPPPVRLSLTFGGLDTAREIWFIASGSGKADAVRRGFGGDPSVPSSRPRGREATRWLIDRDAAADLP